jgi:GxxExxY protein
MDQGRLMGLNKITDRIIGCAIEVHRNLGPGLLESSYEECLAYEMKQQGLIFERQKEMPVVYKGVYLPCGYRLDLLVENAVVVEIKAIATVLPVHEAQVITYLKLSKCDLGLIMNFNVRTMKEGIKRVVLN